MRKASILLSFLLAPGVLCAQDAGGIEVDLNGVEQVDATCRLSFTVRNDIGTPIESLIYETVLFEPAALF